MDTGFIEVNSLSNDFGGELILIGSQVLSFQLTSSTEEVVIYKEKMHDIWTIPSHLEAVEGLLS